MELAECPFGAFFLSFLFLSFFSFLPHKNHAGVGDGAPNEGFSLASFNCCCGLKEDMQYYRVARARLASLVGRQRELAWISRIPLVWKAALLIIIIHHHHHRLTPTRQGSFSPISCPKCLQIKPTERLYPRLIWHNLFSPPGRLYQAPAACGDKVGLF